MLGVGFGDVFFLTGIGFDVVEFLAVDEAELLGHDGGLTPLDGIDDALGVGDEKAINFLVFDFWIKDSAERPAVEFHVGGVLDFAGLEESWDDIDSVAESVEFDVLVEAFVGPVNEHGDAVAAVVGRALITFHAGIEDLGSGGSAVVGGVDKEGVVGDAEVGEELAGGTDVLIDVADHAEECGEVGLLVLIHVHVFLWTVEGAVGGVGGDVGEEGFFGGGFGFDEVVRFLEEDVGAEAFGGNDFSVVEVGAVEVGIVPEVGGLADAASAVAVDFFEAAIFGAVRVVIAEVPFSEHCGGVVFGEVLAEGDFVFANHGAALDGMPDAGAVCPMTGEESSTGGRAGGGDVVVGEDGGLGVEFVEVRGFDDGVAVASEVAVALVISDDDDDVRLISRKC